MRRRRALLWLLWAPLCAQDPFSAEFDVRNRFVTGDRGPVYRSIVNLGEGPRLFNGSMRYEGKDRVDLNLYNWGGDPNSNLRLDARREKRYELLVQYRTLAYFNHLPSFANPLLAQGVTASQRAIDLRRRQLDVDLRLRPRAFFSPFVGLMRTSGRGQGVTPFVGSGDEFPVASRFDDALTTVRGGGQFTRSWWSATVEQGRTSYGDTQDLTSQPNAGNRNDAYVLDRFQERYRARGSGWFTRALFQGQPLSALGFTGNFTYSKPRLETEHELQAEGRFRDSLTLVPYASLLEQSLADANQPRNSGSWSTEFRPHARWRLRHNWFSDAFRISGASPTAALLPVIREGRARLDLRYDQSEADISTDVGNALTLRAGHRYIRSRADLPPAYLTFPGSPTTARMERHAALAGASLRLWQGRGRVHADYEASPGGETYFRTGLQDYRKLALQGKYRLTNSLQVTAMRKTLTNSNVGIEFENRQTAVTLEWLPNQGRRVTAVGTYSRETLDSTAGFVDPTFLEPGVSVYRDHGHHANAYAEVRMWRGSSVHAGGAISSNEGSRPTKYYAPVARVNAPVSDRVSVVGEWRWYRYASLEAFRAHTVSAGLVVRFR